MHFAWILRSLEFLLFLCLFVYAREKKRMLIRSTGINKKVWCFLICLICLFSSLSIHPCANSLLFWVHDSIILSCILHLKLFSYWNLSSLPIRLSFLVGFAAVTQSWVLWSVPHLVYGLIFLSASMEGQKKNLLLFIKPSSEIMDHQSMII